MGGVEDNRRCEKLSISIFIIEIIHNWIGGKLSISISIIAFLRGRRPIRRFGAGLPPAHPHHGLRLCEHHPRRRPLRRKRTARRARVRGCYPTAGKNEGSVAEVCAPVAQKASRYGKYRGRFLTTLNINHLNIEYSGGQQFRHRALSHSHYFYCLICRQII